MLKAVTVQTLVPGEPYALLIFDAYKAGRIALPLPPKSISLVTRELKPFGLLDVESLAKALVLILYS